MLVSAAVIHDGFTVMMVRRGPGKPHAGCWEFPGGKVEQHETPQQALHRELAEELGIDAEVRSLLTTVSNERIRMQVFDTAIRQGRITLSEHDDLRWASPHELRLLPMTDLDGKVIQFLCGR